MRCALFRETGLLIASPDALSPILQQEAENVFAKIYRELCRRWHDATRQRYVGMFVIGPFNCLLYRFSEALLSRLFRTVSPGNREDLRLGRHTSRTMIPCVPCGIKRHQFPLH
jgi:hypothetical protein